MFKHSKVLSQEGVSAVWWGSHEPQDAIMVALREPTSRQLARLRSTVTLMRKGSMGARALDLPVNEPITAGTFRAVAGAVLAAEEPVPNLTVAYPHLLGAAHESEGYDSDESPFTGGDEIWFTLQNKEFCTSNFSFVGANNPNNNWNLTAGHCSSFAGGQNFYTCATENAGNCNYNMGQVSYIYGNGDDFETIGSVPSNNGYVWDHSGGKWSVNGWQTAEMGDGLGTVGATNGATFGNYVSAGGDDTCVDYGSIQTCNAMVLASGSTQICPPGDSGGPIFSREGSSGNIYAYGEILGYYDGPSGDECFGQQMYRIRSEGNLSLVWGS
jgi:hypothetical protein